MSRRSTPERIDEARRAATRYHLIGEGATPETADAWIAAWELRQRNADSSAAPRTGQAGWDWIAEQRAHRFRPWAHLREMLDVARALICRLQWSGLPAGQQRVGMRRR
jgi:hypothetical protein